MPHPSRRLPPSARRLQTLRDAARALGGDLAPLRTAFGEARSGAGPRTAGREAELLTRRDAVQATVARLLKVVDAALTEAGYPEARTEAVADLRAVRRQVLAAGLAAELPQTVEAAKLRFDRPRPDNGSPVLAGQAFATVVAQARAFLVTWAPPGDPDAAPPAHPDMPARLAVLIGTLADARNAGTLTPASERVLDDLKDLKTAVDLRLTLDSTVAGLEAMHDRIRNDPALKETCSVARLCREVSHYGSVFRDAASPEPAAQLKALAVVDSLVHLLGRNEPPATFVTQDPEVRSLLTALRAAAFTDRAAMTFATGKADAGALAELCLVAQAENRIPTAAEILKTLPDDQAKLFDETVRAKIKNAVKLHEAYDDAYRGLERILGADEAVPYRGAVWLQVGIPQPERGRVVPGHEGAVAFPVTPQAVRRAIGRGADIVEHVPRNQDAFGRLQVMRAEAKLAELGRTNPRAAFMVANLAVLEHRIALFEKEVVGRAEYDRFAVASFDPERVMTLAGVSTAQMIRLGYTAEEAERFPEHLQTLSKGGFQGIDHLDSHIRYLHHVARETTTNRSVQEMTVAYAAESPAALGSRLRTEIFSDIAVLGQAGGPGTGSALAPAALEAGTAAVADGFRKMALAVSEAVILHDDLATEESAAVFRSLDDSLVALLHERSALRARLEETRRDLHAASALGVTGGLDLDPVKPAGLRSAKAILAAIEIDTEVQRLEAIGAPQALVDDMRAARDDALDTLRGLDAETMRRPWYGKIANLFGAAARPDIDTLRALHAAAEGIVFVREGFATEQARIDAVIGRAVAQRDAVAAGRMAEDPKVMGSAQQMIRAAVLANWPANNVARTVRDGRVVDAFEPALHRDAIEATLKDWGLDVQAFAPEISMVVNGTLMRHDLENWRRERRPADPETDLIAGPDTRSRGRRIADHLKQEARAVFSRDGAVNAGLYLLNKRQRDETFQATFLAIAGSLKDGDKFDFKTGYRLALNSGKIPVEPTGTVSVRARMAATGLGNLTIERSGDGWKISARAGGQGQVGADVFAEQKLADPVAVGASGSVDLSGGYLGGFTETFRDDVDGRRAFTDLLTALVNGERPKGRVFAGVADAATNREVSGKAGAKGKVYARVEAVAQPFGTDGDMFASEPTGQKSGAGNKVGAGASVSGEIAASLGGKYKVVRSLNKVTYETEREVSAGVNLNLNVYAKLPTGLGALSNAVMQDAQRGADGDPRFDRIKDGKAENAYDVGSGTVNDSLLDANLGAMGIRTKKMKQEYAIAASGEERMTKAELTRRSNVVVGAETALVGICNAEFRARLGTDPEVRRDFDALKQYIDNEDALQVTYALKPDRLRRVNDLLSLADDLARNGRGLSAVALRRQVRDIVDTDDAYEVSKVTVVTKTTQKDLANRGNALLISFDIVAETGVERAQVVWKVPPRKAA